MDRLVVIKMVTRCWRALEKISGGSNFLKHLWGILGVVESQVMLRQRNNRFCFKS